MPRKTPPAFFSREVLNARRFYLNLQPAASDALTVVSGGWERCAATYHVIRGSFPYLGLEFVAGGAGGLRLNGAKHSLRAGAVFTYGPGIPHEIVSDGQHCLSKYFANFVGLQAERLLGVHGLAPGAFRTVAFGDDVQRAFEDLLGSGQRTAGNTARIASLHAEALLLTIADSSGTSKARVQRAFVTYSRCLRYIEEHFLELATLEQAANACHVDVTHVCRLFARFAPQSPYALIQCLKMNHAAALLESGRLLVREVADQLGMDPFHFSRAFKRVHGLSPSAFSNGRLNAQTAL